MYFTQKFIQVSESGCYKENMELVERLDNFFANYPEGCENFKGNMKKMFEFAKERIEKLNFHTGERKYEYSYRKEFCFCLVESFRQKLSEEIGFWWPNEENRKFWQDSLYLMNKIFNEFQRVLLVEECDKRGVSEDERSVIIKHFEYEIR